MNLFFDLEQVSCEEVNLIRHPEHQGEIRRLAGALDAGFRQYADARRDGSRQFPKGMGQARLCSSQDGSAAYRQEYKMYYDR